jgi:hypothetical protein
MKTNKKQFELFKKECQKWIKTFGLESWGVAYYWEKEDSNRVAAIGRDVSSHVATIHFTNEIDDEMDYGMTIYDYIKQCAKHEIIHLLLAEVSEFGKSKHYTISDIEIAEEALVGKLINLL